jgi:hypothetical protein
MTLGVRFHSLLKFLDETSSGRYEADDPHRSGKQAVVDTKDQTRNPVQAAKALTHPKTDQPLSSKLQGMLALLSNYLRSGMAGPGRMLNHARLISGAFMARTDFAHMFTRLPASEQRCVLRHPDRFAELALQAARLTGQGDALLFDRGVRKNTEPASADYNVDRARAATSPIDMSREDWLMGIPTGADSISAAQHPTQKNTLEGLGALGDRTDRVSEDPAPAHGAHDKGRGIILELRQMRTNQTPEEFMAQAQAIFDYLAKVNRNPGYAD